MASRDHLRKAVLEALWNHPEGLQATELVALLPGRELAVTTVLTVLDRLRKEGLVDRERDGRAHRHRAAQSREEFTAAVMLEALRSTEQGSLALARFIDHVTADEADQLRSALSTGCGCGPGCGCRPGPEAPVEPGAGDADAAVTPARPDRLVRIVP